MTSNHTPERENGLQGLPAPRRSHNHRMYDMMMQFWSEAFHTEANGHDRQADRLGGPAGAGLRGFGAGANAGARICQSVSRHGSDPRRPEGQQLAGLPGGAVRAGTEPATVRRQSG